MVAGAAMVGVPLYMYLKYRSANKRIHKAGGDFVARTGRNPRPHEVDRMVRDAKDETNKVEAEPYHKRFQPEVRGSRGVTQQRGTWRQAIKDKFMAATQRHPMIRKALQPIASQAADYVHQRFTDPAKLRTNVDANRRANRQAWRNRPRS